MLAQHSLGCAVQPFRVWLYRLEIATALASAALFALTLIEPQWIEMLFQASPDGGDGSAERWVVGTLFGVAAVLAAALARRERRRLDTAGAAP